MPILDFVKNAVKKESARPFKVPRIKCLLLIQKMVKEHHITMSQ